MGGRFAWSYSRYSMHQKCPFKYDAVVNKGIKQEYGGPHVERGIAVHKLMEHYLKRDIPTVPKELSLFEAELHNLRELKAGAEIDLSVTRDWGKSFGTDWNNVWCRNSLDAHVIIDGTAHVIDLKTGRRYDTHAEQGHLYAAAAMSWFEDLGVERVNVEMWYCDAPSAAEAVSSWEYEIDELSGMQKLWGKRARNMEIARSFPAKPEKFNCRYCHLNPKNGGSCKYAAQE